MAKQLPGYVMFDVGLHVEGVPMPGKVSEISIPQPKQVVEKQRMGGMPAEHGFVVGWECEDPKFKLPGMEPHVLSLVGLKPGVTKAFMFTGALVHHEDGRVSSAVCHVQGSLMSFMPPDGKPGEFPENEFEINPHTWALKIDDVEIYRKTPFDFIVNGESQYADFNQALLYT
jgi:phage tail tube protein FII